MNNPDRKAQLRPGISFWAQCHLSVKQCAGIFGELQFIFKLSDPFMSFGQFGSFTALGTISQVGVYFRLSSLHLNNVPSQIPDVTATSPTRSPASIRSHRLCLSSSGYDLDTPTSRASRVHTLTTVVHFSGAISFFGGHITWTS